MSDSSDMHRYYEGKKLATDYRRYRPAYPPCITEVVMEYLRSQKGANATNGKFHSMLDVGCGSGQSTEMFSLYFDSILGIDISAAQIAVAKERSKSENVVFQAVDDNFFPVEDETVDLVTSGSAAHYLNIETFVEECERVLTPGGCVVLYWYRVRGARAQWENRRSVDISARYIDSQFKFFANCGMQPKHISVELENYQPIYEQIKNKSKLRIENPTSEVSYTMLSLKKAYSTIGEYRKLKEDSKNTEVVDPLELFIDKVRKMVQVQGVTHDDAKIILNFEYPMIVFTKKNA